ncbi:Transposable element Tcb1 transposase [Araneus ventricosus]|uniref:Transposable element Tcb1 transposase n=1 Tax=Araneus ventricosus TaxID=182803 RepID=A0A4Y2E3E0_ARAVE|nr:Transposable element Tcb1 transposase [Araneus ventricosus]
MTSFGASLCMLDSTVFMVTFRIRGQVYHKPESLISLPNEEAKFLQKYVLGNEEAEAKRLCKLIPGTTKSLIESFQKMLHKKSKKFKMAIEDNPTEDLQIVIKADKKPIEGPERVFNTPALNEVAIIIAGNDFEKRDIILTMPSNELKNICETHITCLTLEVSEELGIVQSVIYGLWQRFQDDGNVSRCYSTGRPRVTTPNEDQYLAVTAKRNRRSTASDLSRQLSSATGTTVSRQTVYRRLGNMGLYARRPVRCVPLTATHCRLRLAWSREHALWTPQQWSCVMFSDESRFSLQSDSRRTFIWRAPGTRYHQENTIERHRYGGAGWLVWGGIILGSRTDLHVQSVTMTGHIYRDVILEQHVCLFLGAMGAEFLLMDDNARPHRANIVDECLHSEDITRMDWPAYSPDLNPIEHVWDMLGRRIAAR